MSATVQGTTISLTKGDTLRVAVHLVNKDTQLEYTPAPGDSLRFAMKKRYSDEECVLLKDIDIETLELHLEPSDTSDLQVGRYVYDIQLTFENGDVDTVIPRAQFNLLEEVY